LNLFIGGGKGTGGVGADCSQRHKHVQFIPLPRKDEFSPFPDDIAQSGKENDHSIPFQHFISPIPSSPTSSNLYKTYQYLLSQANPEKVSHVSYNLVMTTDWIFISPRTKDDFISEGYKIAVNSTGMVGLLLTKSEDETAFLEKIGPIKVLASVGKAWS
jgi:sulfate adenylyltransferase (ADP) / ATP adenylyltransferase